MLNAPDVRGISPITARRRAVFAGQKGPQDLSHAVEKSAIVEIPLFYLGLGAGRGQLLSEDQAGSWKYFLLNWEKKFSSRALFWFSAESGGGVRCPSRGPECASRHRSGFHFDRRWARHQPVPIPEAGPPRAGRPGRSAPRATTNSRVTQPSVGPP